MTVDDFNFLVKAELAVADLHNQVSARKPIHAFVLHLKSVLRKMQVCCQN